MVKAWILLISITYNGGINITVDNIATEKSCIELGESIIKTKTPSWRYTCHVYEKANTSTRATPRGSLF